MNHSHIHTTRKSSTQATGGEGGGKEGANISSTSTGWYTHSAKSYARKKPLKANSQLHLLVSPAFPTFRKTVLAQSCWATLSTGKSQHNFGNSNVTCAKKPSSLSTATTEVLQLACISDYTRKCMAMVGLGNTKKKKTLSTVRFMSLGRFAQWKESQQFETARMTSAATQSMLYVCWQLGRKQEKKKKQVM